MMADEKSPTRISHRLFATSCSEMRVCVSKKLLAVIDMQNDFITGALGNAQCRAVVSNVVKKVNHTDADIVYTLDTHGEDYPDTQEGRKLPVKHCIKGTPGWELIPELEHIQEKTHFEKNTFGSTGLAEWIRKQEYTEVELIGVCTDICVISNAMTIKAFNPEVEISVDAGCCAGVTPQSHKTALDAMRGCQIRIEE